MARVGQYKALGTKLGGYKSTLSKIESKEYGKKHADWKAAEETSLYNQIGGTVANVIGIVQEQRLAREQADMYAREFGFDPGDKFAKRVTKEGKEQNPWLKLSEEAQDEAFWADENMSDRVVGLPETLFQGEPGETSPISRQNISGGIADTETAYQESLKNFSPSPRKSIHQLESEALRRGATMAGPSSADSRVIKQTIGEELEFGHAAQKEVKPEAYPSNKTFAPGYEQDYDTAGGRAGTTAYKKIEGKTADVKEAKGYQSWLPEVFEPEPERPKVSTVDEQPSPITNDMAFDAIAEPSLGDFDKSKLPSVDPVRDAILAKFKGSGATSEKIDQIAQEFASVETGGRNIQQSGDGPGEGFFQFEVDERGGSGEFKIALNRMKRLYDPSGTSKRKVGKRNQGKAPKWIDEALKHGSPMKLTEDQQKSLLLANLFMKDDSDALFEKGFRTGDFSELYTDMHYAGAKGDSLARAQKIEDYKRRRKDVR